MKKIISLLLVAIVFLTSCGEVPVDTMTYQSAGTIASISTTSLATTATTSASLEPTQTVTDSSATETTVSTEPEKPKITLDEMTMEYSFEWMGDHYELSISGNAEVYTIYERYVEIDLEEMIIDGEYFYKNDPNRERLHPLYLNTLKMIFQYGLNPTVERDGKTYIDMTYARGNPIRYYVPNSTQFFPNRVLEVEGHIGEEKKTFEIPVPDIASHYSDDPIQFENPELEKVLKSVFGDHISERVLCNVILFDYRYMDEFSPKPPDIRIVYYPNGNHGEHSIEKFIPLSRRYVDSIEDLLHFPCVYNIAITSGSPPPKKDQALIDQYAAVFSPRGIQISGFLLSKPEVVGK